jgi:hypothetical protein
MKPALTSPGPDEPYANDDSRDDRILSTHHLSSLFYRGELVDFYEEKFHNTITEDPLNSCLASRLLSGK